MLDHVTMRSSSEKVSVPTLALCVTAALALGLVAGWLAAGKLTADWVGAAGTWAGAFGTVGAIAWAIHTFAAENKAKIRARIEAEREHELRQAALAEGVRVACRGGGGRGTNNQMYMTSVHVDFVNETQFPVGVVGFRLPGVELESGQHWPPTLAGGSSITREISTKPFPCPDDEFSGRPLTSVTPTIVYRINGARWTRTGNATPSREP